MSSNIRHRLYREGKSSSPFSQFATEAYSVVKVCLLHGVAGPVSFSTCRDRYLSGTRYGKSIIVVALRRLNMPSRAPRVVSSASICSDRSFSLTLTTQSVKPSGFSDTLTPCC